MIKYICDKCLDSFTPDGIYHVDLKNMKFDLCGHCYTKFQEVINQWFLKKGFI